MKLLELLKDLFGKNKKFELPRTESDIGEYAANFTRAIEFTRHCGFHIESVEWFNGDAIGDNGGVITQVLDMHDLHDASTSATQCLKWCHFLAPSFESVLQRKVWLTIGQIWKGDSVIFSPTWDDLKKWSQSGIQLDDFTGRAGVNVHAWLTVESGEIIDLTFLSSLSLCGAGRFAKFAGGIVWGRDPGVWTDLRYFPMAVGCEFAEEINLRSIVPILANNSDELQYQTGMLVIA